MNNILKNQPIAITADLHIKLHKDSKIYTNEETHETMPLRLYEFFAVFSEDFLAKVKSLKIKNIALLGDINDLKGIVHARAFVLFKKLLAKHNDLEFFILHGNHDKTSRYGQESAIHLLDGPKNIHTIAQPLITDNITWLPYHNKMIEYFENFQENQILFTHMGLSDAELSPGISIQQGLASKDILNKFQIAISGHYHKPQNINNFWYCGSLIPFRADEYNQQKRFLVLDTHDLTIESYVIEHPHRKYHKLYINHKDEVNAILQQAEDLKNQGHFVIVENNTKPLDTKDYITGVKLIEKQHIESTQRGIINTMTLKEKMQHYMTIQAVPEEKQAFYLQIAQEILYEE